MVVGVCCPRCGGQVIPDDDGAFRCLQCSRPLCERDGVLTLLIERGYEPETAPQERASRPRLKWTARTR